jgi:hypothetical protein
LDETLIKELLEFAFHSSDDKPNKEKVYRTLLEDPRQDHHWFKFIEKFGDYKQYESVVYIHKMISKFLRDLIDLKFNLQEINQIKN